MIDVSGHNPFSTRYFAPGSIPFHFPEAMSIDLLADRIADAKNRRAAIVGPHGSGKSTLLTELFSLPSLRSRFPDAHHRRLNSSSTAIERWRSSFCGIEAGGLLVLDGFEQLSNISRWILQGMCNARRVTLLISAHELPAGFEQVWGTCINGEIEQHVIASMLADHTDLEVQDILQSDAWAQSRSTHGHNLRESLFDMYDWYRDHVDVPKAPR